MLCLFSYPLWADDTLNDPTRPLVYLGPVSTKNIKQTTKKAVKNNKLQAIIRYKKLNYAIINGKQVASGDKVNGFVVQSIKSESVVLKKGRKLLTLRLNPLVKKKHKEG